jgi:hypothetical protein
MDTFYDLTRLLTEVLTTGAVSTELFPNSQDTMDVVLGWANEFNQRYAWATWEDEEYMETLEEWFRNMLQLRYAAFSPSAKLASSVSASRKRWQ